MGKKKAAKSVAKGDVASPAGQRDEGGGRDERGGDKAGPPAGAGGEASVQPLSGKTYASELKKLHVELVKLQQWVVAKGLKVCILFEGRDGAGKGGTIKAITERVSPRVFRVVALPAPTEREKSQMYVQRYFRHLPAAGEVVISIAPLFPSINGACEAASRSTASSGWLAKCGSSG